MTDDVRHVLLCESCAELLRAQTIANGGKALEALEQCRAKLCADCGVDASAAAVAAFVPATCPMCGQPAPCGGHAIAGIELTADQAARKVRFRVLFGDGKTFCSAIPADEAAALGADLLREAAYALTPEPSFHGEHFD